MRGTSLRALLLALYFANAPESQERQWGLLDWVQKEGSIALQAGAAEHLGYLLSLDDKRAVALFKGLLAEHPELLRSAPAHHFIYYALRKHFGKVQPYIRAVLNDEHPHRRRVGARLACLSAFTHPEAESMAEVAITGDTAQRLGAADIYSANLWQTDIRCECEAGLRRLMNDPENRVRWEVGTCFGKLGDDDFEDLRGFVEDFAHSRAFCAYPQGCLEYVYDPCYVGS